MTRIQPRVFVAALLALGLAGVRPLPSLAATTVTGCPTTESAISADIVGAGNGGTVLFNCTSATTIAFDFAHGGTGTITISQSVTLDASGSTGGVTFDGGGSTQLFSVSSGVTFTLNGLTLKNGFATSGGAIFNGGTLTIAKSTLSGNSATYGGAVYNKGTVSIATSTLSDNSADWAGGAIYNSFAALSITNSTLSGNSAPFFGGAIYGGGTVSVTNSTLSGNSTSFEGGAIFNNGTGTITTSTLSGNSAADGGAFWSNATLTITTSTLSGNSAGSGGAIDKWNGTATVGGSIIANSPSGGNCISHFNGPITDGGYNLTDSSGNCGLTRITDLTNTNPQLDPSGLQHNGGPTQTIALEQGSPAIDQIPVAGGLCTPTDQRGFARPDDNETSCDIGAYESAPPRSTIRPHGVRVVAFQNTGCTTTTLIATVTPAGSPGGALTFEDTRPTGAPCSPFKAGALSFRSLSIASVVCTSTTATVHGTARESVSPSTTASTVSFAASVNRLPMPGKPQNGTFQLYTSDGYTSGAISSFTSILC